MAQNARDAAQDSVPQPDHTGIAPASPPGRPIPPPTSTVLGSLENILKLIAAGVGIVAALGFPAVYLHFLSFRVPTVLMSYNHILRAGVLPAVLLTLFATYFCWAVKAFQTGKIPM